MKNIASIIIVFSFLCGLYSCNTEELQDLNINPTAANSIDPGFILAFAQLRTANSASWGQLSYQSTMIQHLASLTEFVAGDKYLYRDQTVDALWNSAYPIYLKELVNLLKLTASDPQLVNYHAIASIWKVFAMHRVTDLYGDVPYYQAGKGFLEQNFNPVYDSQDAIYADMLLELENAAEALTNSAPNPGIQDLIYQGDIDKWRKFAYSMMLRLGMRLTKVDPGMAQNWVSKAIAGGVMDGTEDTNFMRHADGPETINNNGIGQFLGWDGSKFMEDNQRLSATLVDLLTATGDPRLDLISWVSTGGPHKGLPNGFDFTTIQSYPGGADLETYSRINPLLVLTSSPMIFQTYAEVQFLLAEAVERGWYSGDAATHYTNGVKAAMKLYTLYDPTLLISDAAIEAYLNANSYNSAEWQRMIGEQVWIVTFLNGYEAYSNWRRTGYPTLTPVNYPGNESNGTIPRRLRYPQIEASINGDAYRAALDRQGPDAFTTRMWWDSE